MSKDEISKTNQTTTEEPQHKTQQTDTRKSTDTSQNAAADSHRVLMLPKVLRFIRRNCVALALILVYLTQAYYIKKQWEVMEQTLGVTKESIEAAHRAWIIFDRADFVASKIPQRLGVELYFKNTSTEPAVNVHAVQNTSDGMPISIPKGSKSLDRGAVLGGGQQILINTDIPSSFDTNKPPHIFGVVTYEDRFNRQRETTFCVYLDRPNVAGKSRFAPCPKFNDAQ